tara:strand:- start:25695 stop:25931 length:237 start_codon:yes stop_codon:yes gene_type:complete
MGVIDPSFKADARKFAKPLINFVWTALIISILFGLAAKFLWSGYPPAIAWLEPWFELSGILGLAGGGILIADRHPLVK